jgi:hypothetical protein
LGERGAEQEGESEIAELEAHVDRKYDSRATERVYSPLGVYTGDLLM